MPESSTKRVRDMFDLIIEELGLENANGSDVTGSKVENNETDTELDP